MELTHFNAEGRAKMVDVSDKQVSKRTATAYGRIYLQEETIEIVKSGKTKKGDALAVAQVGGIMGAKKTSELIPMCHNIPIDGVDINFNYADKNHIEVYAKAVTTHKTGIEMEVLTAAAIALLTLYDMLKAIDKLMVIEEIKLIEKTK